jgi:hypothetical protein
MPPLEPREFYDVVLELAAYAKKQFFKTQKSSRDTLSTP